MIKNAKRNSKGQFEVCWNHPEVDAWIAAEHDQALKFIKACKALGFDAEKMGVVKGGKGSWRVRHNGKETFVGIALGLGIALKKSKKEIRDLLFLVADGAGILPAK